MGWQSLHTELDTALTGAIKTSQDGAKMLRFGFGTFEIYENSDNSSDSSSDGNSSGGNSSGGSSSSNGTGNNSSNNNSSSNDAGSGINSGNGGTSNPAAPDSSNGATPNNNNSSNTPPNGGTPNNGSSNGEAPANNNPPNSQNEQGVPNNSLNRQNEQSALGGSGAAALNSSLALNSSGTATLNSSLTLSGSGAGALGSSLALNSSLNRQNKQITLENSNNANNSNSTDSSSTSSNSSDSTSQSSSNTDSSSSNDALSEKSDKALLSNIPICVLIVASDSTVTVAPNSTATIPVTTRADVAAAVIAQNKKKGTLADYGLYYYMDDSGTDTRIALADISDMKEQIVSLFATLFVGWIALLVAVFIISFFLARYVSKPVQRAWDDQQRFIADASHELKTPLTVMLADTSILQANPEKTIKEQHAWVDSIQVEAQRMQQLTEDMLTLAQADAGVDISQIKSNIDVSQTVQGVALQFEAVAFERGLNLQADIANDLHVIGDERRLESLAKTLLENACKYTSSNGTISLKLEKSKNNAQLSIHNDGEPIPEADLPHLFDRFYRSDKARTSEGASASFGLGLSIAKATVEAHNGEISVKSGEGGTTFIVKIPLAKANSKPSNKQLVKEVAKQGKEAQKQSKLLQG